MSVATFTGTGTKATVAAKLDKKVFGVEVTNHELLKQAYLTYLANGRNNLAVVKKRGEVRGGGRKPWRQKGTGNARVGSIRSPIWRGGGITFGPTGKENYTRKISTQAKRQAIRQALSLASESGKIIVIEKFESKDGKTKGVYNLLNKIGATRSVLLVVDSKDSALVRATNNLDEVTLVTANYLNVFDILNAHTIVITSPALSAIQSWLNVNEAPAKVALNSKEAK